MSHSTLLAIYLIPIPIILFIILPCLFAKNFIEIKYKDEYCMMVVVWPMVLSIIGILLFYGLGSFLIALTWWVFYNTFFKLGLRIFSKSIEFFTDKPREIDSVKSDYRTIYYK